MPCQVEIARLVLPREPGLGGIPSPAPNPELYQGLYAAAAAAAQETHQQLAGARLGAEELVLELDRFAPERRLIVVCNSRRFRTFPLCELLLRQSQAAWFSSPKKAQERAELAVAVAETLDDAAPDPALVADLRTRAWSLLANANRILGDLVSAERCFRNAREHLARGTCHPETEAQLLELEISLLTTQRDYEGARRLADQALRLYRRIGDTHLQGRVCLRKGIFLGYQQQTQEAIRWLSRGLERIDLEREPGLELGGRHNLALFLIEDGQIDRAEKQLSALEPLYRIRNEPLNSFRLEWLKGKIALARGEMSAARDFLQATFDGFAAADTGLDAALVGLELVEALFELGRREELLALCLALLTLFRSRQVHQEALAALLLLHRTAHGEALTKDLLHRLARFLQRAQQGAQVSFEDEFGPS
jgi:tetratricopeptide (TPR) repeat protein